MGLIRVTMLWCFALIGFSSPLDARPLCVFNEFANLRAGPSTSAEQTWRVTRYMPLQMLKKENAWYQVKDLHGRTHWIREDLVTQAFRCVVIKNEYANLRMGPGTHFAQTPAKKGNRYLSFRFLEERRGWVRVEDVQGDIAWIHRPLVWMP